MKRSAVALLLAASSFQAGCSQPRDLYQPAVVSMVDSRPCFSVGDSPETRRARPRIAALTVLSERDAGSEMAWAIDLTEREPAVELAPENCLAYGEALPGARVIEAPRQLRAGERYSVSINAHIQDPRSSGTDWNNRVYRLSFCLALSGGGVLEVREVPWRRGQWAWHVCD